MVSKMAVAKSNIRKYPLFKCFLAEINVVVAKIGVWVRRKGLRSTGCSVAMITTILLPLSVTDTPGIACLPPKVMLTVIRNKMQLIALIYTIFSRLLHFYLQGNTDYNFDLA